MILVGNGRVITGDSNNPFIENGAVVIEGNRIKEVGSYEALKNKYESAEFINAKNMIIMPGFINTHHHIYSAFARGLVIPNNNPKNFLDILKNTWWYIDQNLTLENTYYSAEATFLECIKNGVTTVIDHHASYGDILGSLFEIEKAAEKLNIRSCLSYEVSNRAGKNKMMEAVKENIDFIKYTNKKNNCMIKALFGMHASFTLDDETLNYCVEQNTEKAGYHIHVAEGLYDEMQCEKEHNMTVVERLNKFGILNKDSIAAHCIHIKETDMDILKDTDTMVLHNPESNMGNAVGAPDVIGILDKGILTGLGTDGYTSDMLESLKVANIFQKHKRGIPDRGFNEAMELLFNNNRKIAARIFKEDIGVLKEGALADIITIDYHNYTNMKEDNIGGHIVFGMNGAMVNTTIINGKILMRDRKLINIDEEELLHNCRKSSEKLWERVINNNME